MTAEEAIELENAPGAKGAGIPDDMAMLRAAVELTRDIAAARPAIYWPDMLLSAALGYGGLYGAIVATQPLAALACAVASAFGLYRAFLFIHELTHIHKDALPGFRFAWNVIVGIPMLMPSFVYEGVHTLHHARTRYGTAEDPEYLPLARMNPVSLPMFAFLAFVTPPSLRGRSAVRGPRGAVPPPLRRLVWAHLSSLSINPAFRRRPPEGAFARMVFWQELGASAWSWTVLWWSWHHGWRPLLVTLAIFSSAALLNQVRTLVAHLWENAGEPMTVTAQFLDSVNVPPPGPLSPLWAPVGLRFHALHHLLPSMPYHALGEAHRRLSAHLGPQSTYQRASYPGLMPLLGRLVRATMRI